MNLIPGALIVVDGRDDAIDLLIDRAASVNEQRLVWTPGPLVVRRGTEPGVHSREVIQPALAAGSPLIVAGGVTDEVIAAGEPIADLRVHAIEVPSELVVEPNVSGTIRSGYDVTVFGAHSGDFLLHFFQALVQASLAGLPVERRR
jgi:hypothetical protein